MTKVKTANYTDVQMEVLRDGYTGKDNKRDVAILAEAVGKSEASVRAKLANMGLYQPAQSVSTAQSKVTKAMKAEQIATATGMNEVEQEALTKTTGAVLDKLIAGLTN